MRRILKVISHPDARAVWVRDKILCRGLVHVRYLGFGLYFPSRKQIPVRLCVRDVLFSSGSCLLL